MYARCGSAGLGCDHEEDNIFSCRDRTWKRALSVGADISFDAVYFTGMVFDFVVCLLLLTLFRKPQR